MGSHPSPPIFSSSVDEIIRPVVRIGGTPAVSKKKNLRSATSSRIQSGNEALYRVGIDLLKSMIKQVQVTGHGVFKKALGSSKKDIRTPIFNEKQSRMISTV